MLCSRIEVITHTKVGAVNKSMHGRCAHIQLLKDHDIHSLPVWFDKKKSS